MNASELINKEKLRCDDIVSITLIVILGFLAIFSLRLILMSVIIYPLSSLFLYGIYKTYNGLFKKNKMLSIRLLNFILGIVYLSFSGFFLYLIFSQPHVPISYVIYFLSLPLFLIGLAAILKGIIIRVYSLLYRALNFATGVITIIITLYTLYYAEAYFIFSLMSLLGLLALNGIVRSGLYLSEYGLSLKNLRNIRFVFYIMDNLLISNSEVEEY